MLDWLPPSWQVHHGQDLNITVKNIEHDTLTSEEKADGVLELQIALGWCSAQTGMADNGNRCRKDFVFTRHRYAGGWGPPHRVQDSKAKAQYRKRCALARESDWVWGYDPVTFQKVKRAVGA